jgi:hypothetical protein
MVKQAAAKPELKEKLEAVKKVGLDYGFILHIYLFHFHLTCQAYESQRRFCAKEVKDTG